MARNETRLVRLWQLRVTDGAILFSKEPPTEKKEPNGETWMNMAQCCWIPRSLIEHVSRDPKLPCGWQPCNVTLAAWKAEQLGL